MKTQIMIVALVLSASLLTAQTNEERPVTVRVKKIEKINGVDKLTDTTYTVKGPFTLKSIDEVNGTEPCKKGDKPKRITIITDEVNSDNVTIVNKGDVMDEQLENALKAAGVDGKNLAIDKLMVVSDNVIDIKDTDKNGQKTHTKIVIVKTTRIIDPSEEDAKMLNKQTGMGDNKLAVEEMKFYPNPNNGKFNLSFNLKDKGNTEITILNMEGKTVHSEKLSDFSGSYDKEIDISKNPKGVYFVRIEQGKHSQLKKIVLDN